MEGFSCSDNLDIGGDALLFAAIQSALCHVKRSRFSGSFFQLVAEKIREVDLLVLETNHDEQMLVDGPYPWELKQRIRSNHGHLSNRQSARLLSMALTPRLKHIVLAHLSDENNTPELARQAIEQVVGDHPVTISVGKQLCAMGPFEVRAAISPA